MNKRALTSIEISALQEDLRPGYEGVDEIGRFKIDKYGDKKRPFEAGGPSPNPKGPAYQPPEIIPKDILDDNGWMSPVEFLLAVQNGDIRAINRCRPRGSKIDPSKLSIQDQMRAAEKLLPYVVKQAKDQALTIESKPSEDAGRAKLSLPSEGRRSLIEKD